jgi:hypothetical protein
MFNWGRRTRAAAEPDPAREATRFELRKDDFGVFASGYAAQCERGFKPRGDLPALRIAPPLDWGMDPYQDRNWCFQLQAWRMLGPIWEEFHGRDWARLKAEILPWILDWHRYHVVEGRESQFSWYDMSAGLRAQHLALLVHLHRQGSVPLDGAELEVVRALSELHVARLRSPGFIASNNHGLFQVRGLRLLGAVWEGESFVAGEREFSARVLKRLLADQFDAAGVHVENSPDYHGLVYRKFAEIRPELFPGLEAQLRKTLRQAREVLPWFTFPDQTIANIGDSAGASEHLSPRAKPDHVLEGPAGEFWVRDLAQSGYAVVRSHPETPPQAAAMLVVKGQALSQTHAHADHLGLVLYHAGRHLLADSGKYSYNHDAWRDYFISDRAHNVVGLAGGAFGPQHTTTVGPGLDHVAVANGAVTIEGEVVRREFFRHRRSIVFRPGESLDVLDRIEARPADAPVAYWHLAPGIDAEKSAGGVDLFSNGSRLARLEVADPLVKARLVHGQTEPRIQGWVSRAYGSKEAATVIEFRAPPGCTQIATRIALFRPDPPEGGKLPRRICHGIRFRFPFVFRFDRVHVQRDGRTRRVVTVDIPEAFPVAVTNGVSAALQEKGFRVLAKSAGKGVHAVDLAHEDRTRATIRVHAARDGHPARLVLGWERMPRAGK